MFAGAAAVYAAGMGLAGEMPWSEAVTWLLGTGAIARLRAAIGRTIKLLPGL